MGNDMKKSKRFRWSICSGKGWSICVGNRWSLCSETGGQFKLKVGGQFHRFFHHSNANVVDKHYTAQIEAVKKSINFRVFTNDEVCVI